MRLAILGATGPTGQQLVKQALQAGHMVTALVRNPAKLPIKDKHLSIIQCQATTFLNTLLGRFWCRPRVLA